MPWMEQAYVFALQVTRSQRTFVGIASLTTQGKIVKYGLAVQLLRNDVIYLEGQQGDSGGEVAVLTSLLRALPDKLFKFGVHGVTIARDRLVSTTAALWTALFPRAT